MTTSLHGSTEPETAAVHLPLGRAEYRATHDLQLRLHALRSQGAIPDTILSVEHDPVFTIGRRGSRTNLLVGKDTLEREGIAVYEVERGGDITYHGPGQVVLYPIVDLRDHGKDIAGYVRGLEQAVIGVLARLGVEADRRPGLPGVWVKERKIAAIGVHVRKWVTLHGLALNVRANREHFAMINPCGMKIEAVSLDDLVDRRYSLAEVISNLLEAMETLFGWRVVEEEPERFLKERG